MTRFILCVLFVLSTLSSAFAGTKVQQAKVKAEGVVVLSDEVDGRRSALDLGRSYITEKYQGIDVCVAPFIADKKVGKDKGRKSILWTVRFKRVSTTSSSLWVSANASIGSGSGGYGHYGSGTMNRSGYSSGTISRSGYPSSSRPCVPLASAKKMLAQMEGGADATSAPVASNTRASIEATLEADLDMDRSQQAHNAQLVRLESEKDAEIAAKEAEIARMKAQLAEDAKLLEEADAALEALTPKVEQ